MLAFSLSTLFTIINVHIKFSKIEDSLGRGFVKQRLNFAPSLAAMLKAC